MSTEYTLLVRAELSAGVALRRRITTTGGGDAGAPDETWIGRRIGFRHNTLDPDDLFDEQFAGWPGPEQMPGVRSTGEGVRIVVGERVTARLDSVSSLQQVLVSPAGTVLLLMDGENGKDVLAIATKDGLRQFTIGDRGFVAWPAWMG